MDVLKKSIIASIYLGISIVTFPLCSHAAEENSSLFDLSLIDLQNIEIRTAGKTEEKIKNISASVLIVTRDDIEKFGYTTLTDILENVPGLYNIYSYNGAPGNFGIRGFWNPYSQNSNIAFLVNGVKQLNDSTQSNPMAKINVPVEAIDRIEIIKGPMSVIYGSGASFGVINIITNDVNDTNDVSIASLTYGSRDTRKAALRLSQKTDDLKLVFNAAEYRTDGLDNKFADMMSPGNQALLPLLGVTDPDYSTKNLLENWNQYVGISGSYKNVYFDAALNNTEVDIYAIAPSLRDGIERSSNNIDITLGYKNDINDWFSIDTHIAYFDHSKRDVFDFVDAAAYGLRYAEYNAWEAELVTNFRPDQQWNIIAGLYQRTLTDNSETYEVPVPQSGISPIHQSYERGDRTTQAVFTQATYFPTDKLTLVAGVRWENNLSYDYEGVEDIGLPTQSPYGGHVPSYNQFLPRLAAIYHFNPSHTVKLLYGEASKLVADDSDEPEKTETVEVNYIFTRPDYSISTSVFFNEMENLYIQDIITEPDGSLGYVRTRGGRVETIGIEMIAHGYLRKHLFGEISYTYQQSEDISHDTDAAYSPDSVAMGKLSYQQQTSTYSLAARYISAMAPSFDVGDTVGDYMVFDLNYRRDKLIAGGYLNIRLSNLFDREVRYPNNTEFNELLDKGTIGTERSIYGTIGWKF